MKNNKAVSFISTFIICAVFWLLLTMSLAPKELIFGAIVCTVSALFCMNYFSGYGDNTIKMLNPVRLVMLLFFWIFVFLPELIKANNGMVKTVFSNKPLKQGIIKLEVKGITDRYALANLADCITMTPGTITMDISREGDRYFYYIHWIDMETEDPEKAGEMIKGRFERWIGRIWR